MVSLGRAESAVCLAAPTERRMLAMLKDLFLSVVGRETTGFYVAEAELKLLTLLGPSSVLGLQGYSLIETV